MGRAAKLQSLFETAMTDFTEQLHMAYQVITSEFTGGAGHTGMSVAAGSNEFMDINIGAQLRIGK